MCYTGECFFENNMGDCCVFNHGEFEERFGMTPCFVGGTGLDEDEQVAFEERWVDVTRARTEFVSSRIKAYGSCWK